MPKTILQKKVMSVLVGMEKNLESLRNDFSNIMAYIKDTKLTDEEKKQLNESIAKIRSNDTSGFIPWKDAKAKQGL